MDYIAPIIFRLIINKFQLIFAAYSLSELSLVDDKATITPRKYKHDLNLHEDVSAYFQKDYTSAEFCDE